MPADTSMRELLDLTCDLRRYLEELQSRINLGKSYNFFGTFMHNVLGFSEATLQKRGIFKAEDKKPLAERLLRATEFALDGTIKPTENEPDQTPTDELATAIFNGGRLGGLKARLDVHQGLALYDAELLQRGNAPVAALDRGRTEVMGFYIRQAHQPRAGHSTRPQGYGMFDTHRPVVGRTRPTIDANQGLELSTAKLQK